MKIFSAVVLLLLCTASVKADLIIVQEEDQVFSGGTNKIRETVKIKGAKIRIDMDIPEMPMSVINDNASGWGVTLLHKAKKVIEGSAAGQKEGMESVVDTLREEGRIPNERPQIRPTGRKDVINGWEVEEYVAETNYLKASYWIAKELAPLKKYHAALKNKRHAEIDKQFPDLAQAPGFPVLTIVDQQFGKSRVKTTTRVLSIQERDVPDSEFMVPADYTKDGMRGADRKRPQH